MGSGLLLYSFVSCAISLAARMPVAGATRSKARVGPAESIRYYVDAAAFDSVIDAQATLNLTQTDYVWWVLYAASQWRVRSGADVSFDYLGTTTTDCGTSEGGSNYDDTNVVGSVSYCGVNCEVRGITFMRYSGANMVEADICMYDGVTWDIEADLASTSWDLIGSMVHEFGHALGLDHTTSTTMEGGGYNAGNTIRRHLTGDDIEGIRAIYGVRSFSEYVREYNASTNSVGSVFSKAGNVNIPVAGAVVLDGGVWKVLRAAMNTSAATLYVDRTDYQASSGSSWSNASVSVPTWWSPAIASNDSTTDQTISVVSPITYDTYTGACNGVRSRTSTDLFVNRTTTDTDDVCTSHQVAVTYDPQSDRWVLAWVALFDDGSADEALQGSILMRTSTDGRTWSSASELETDLFTIDAPSLACDDSDCVLSFVDGNSDKPTPRNVMFSISGSTITLGTSTTEGSSFTARTPAFGFNSAGYGYQLMFWTGTYSSFVNGRSSIYAVNDSTMPLGYSTWTSLGETSDVTPSVGHHHDRNYGYIFIAE